MMYIYIYCIYQLSKEHVAGLQRTGECHGLLVVHVVIHGAVNEEEGFIAELLGDRTQSGLRIAQGIVLLGGQTHEAFGVDGICCC